MNYLLDTNIVVFLFKDKFEIREKIRKVGEENCFISEITLAELKFGAENSSNKEKHRKEVADLLKAISVILIGNSLDTYAKEKTRLRKLGTPIDDFDLIIGSTAIANEMIMVTNNLKHFSRLDNIKTEDWTKE